jgi:hypothetical protein
LGSSFPHPEKMESSITRPVLIGVDKSGFCRQASVTPDTNP